MAVSTSTERFPWYLIALLLLPFLVVLFLYMQQNSRVEELYSKIQTLQNENQLNLIRQEIQTSVNQTSNNQQVAELLKSTHNNRIEELNSKIQALQHENQLHAIRQTIREEMQTQMAKNQSSSNTMGFSSNNQDIAELISSQNSRLAELNSKTRDFENQLDIIPQIINKEIQTAKNPSTNTQSSSYNQQISDLVILQNRRIEEINSKIVTIENRLNALPQLISQAIQTAMNQTPNLTPDNFSEEESLQLADAELEWMPGILYDPNLNWDYLLEAGYSFGRFIGLKQNYAEIGLIGTSPFVRSWQPFYDLRAYRFDNGRWGSSIGLGTRYWDDARARLWGGNVYYDYANASMGSFHRLGLGFESLGCWDFRLNSYIPVGRTVHRSSPHVFDDYIGDYVAICREQQFQFYGVESEVGSCLTNLGCGWRLYGALGPYYYYSSDPVSVYGGYARLELNYLDYFRAELRTSSDTEFGTNVQGRIMVSLPLEDLFFGCCQPRNCLPPRVRRNGVIFTEKCCNWDWNWDDTI